MKIQVDKEGGQLIDSMVDVGMRAGAYGAGNIKALYVLQATVEVIKPEEDKQGGEEESNGEDKEN